MFDGIGWFMNTLLGALSLLISSILMLRSNIYNKSTAYVWQKVFQDGMQQLILHTNKKWK